MTSKLPEDAFAFYVALGADRGYQAVAEHFHVAKRTVTRAAKREKWMARLDAIEKKTRELTDQRLADDLHQMQLRHRKIITAMGARAAKAIAEFPLTTGMEGMRAAEMAIKLERLVSGEPNERTQVSIEEVTRREIERFLVPAKGSPADDGEGDDDEWDAEPAKA